MSEPIDVADLARRAAEALENRTALHVTPAEFSALRKAAPEREYDAHLRASGVNPSWAGIPVVVDR